MPFDTQDVLRQAGYSEGDFIPVVTAQVNVSQSTSSTSFTNLTGTSQLFTVNFDQFPANATVSVQLTAARVRNDTSGETTTARPTLRSDGRSFSNAELTATGRSIFNASSSRDVTDFRGVDSLQVEGKVTGTSTGSLRGIGLVVGVTL